MKAFESQREMLSVTAPTTSVDVTELGVFKRGFGRSSPPYGPMTSTFGQPSCPEFHVVSFGGDATDPISEISEPDPAKTVTTAVDSPCIGVCSTTFDSVCIGCGRSVSEVAQWAVMSDDQKELVWQRIVLNGFPRTDRRNPSV